MTSLALLVAGVLFVGISAIMSLLLVLEHLGGMSLPGCGPGGPCAQAAGSIWGAIRVGGFRWPVSYLGLAYFAAVLSGWIATRGVVPPTLRHFVRLGALVSLGYCIIMVAERMICPYCIGAHLGNIAFWMTMEAVPVRPARLRVAAITGSSVFAVLTVLLGVWDAQVRAAVQARAELDRSVAAQDIIGQSRQRIAPPATPPSAPVAGMPALTTKEAKKPAAAGVEAAAPQPEPPPARPAMTEPMFTGRYRVGPAEAPIRIVMFTDYQCEDCRNLEHQLVELHESRNDISISIKHFPFDKACNEAVAQTLHPNACWAARAAEAAGKLWGPEGFWKMHVWLFNRHGVFRTQDELENGIREMGFDPAGFAQVMSGEEVLKSIRADAAEAQHLGLYFTPMIFINGVELKGWVAPSALIRTVEQVAATSPPARSAAFDRPPPAYEKYIADWRDQPQLMLPADKQEWALGPAAAKVRIVLWGDYQEAGTTEADAIIRSFAARRNDMQYAYRHFPFNSDCNPSIEERRHPNACQAAKAAEAAGRLHGNDGYWKMHAWLMENREQVSDATLRAAATQMGIDADALFAAMGELDTQASILDDIQAGKQLPRLRHGMPPGLHAIPTIFVSGRYVPRWRLGDKSVLKDILIEAAR